MEVLHVILTRSMIAKLCGSLTTMFLCVGCQPSEDQARAKVEAMGCADVTVTRDADVSKMFSYTATCGGRKCMGFLTLGGSTQSSSHTCFDAAEDNTDTTSQPTAPVEGPGKVVIGEGGVTGTCDKAKTRAALEATLPELKACFDKDLQKHPDLMGTVTAVWETDEAGKADVGEIESELPMIDCIRGVIGAVEWEKPREGKCMTRWSFGLYTKDPPEDLGHARYPRMEACPNPISFALREGEERIAPGDFTKTFGGTYELERIVIWSSGDEDKFIAVADNYGKAPEGDAPVEARSTLMCHTQNLHYTTTTTTDKDGKETTTKKLSEDDSTTLNGNATLASVLDTSSGKISSLKSFQVDLKNGKFFAKNRSKPDTENATMQETLEGLIEHELFKDAAIIRTGKDSFRFALMLEQNGFQFAAQGTYKKK